MGWLNVSEVGKGAWGWDVADPCLICGDGDVAWEVWTESDASIGPPQWLCAECVGAIVAQAVSQDGEAA